MRGLDGIEAGMPRARTGSTGAERRQDAQWHNAEVGANEVDGALCERGDSAGEDRSLCKPADLSRSVEEQTHPEESLQHGAETSTSALHPPPLLPLSERVQDHPAAAQWKEYTAQRQRRGSAEAAQRGRALAALTASVTAKRKPVASKPHERGGTAEMPITALHPPFFRPSR